MKNRVSEGLNSWTSLSAKVKGNSGENRYVWFRDTRNRQKTRDAKTLALTRMDRIRN